MKKSKKFRNKNISTKKKAQKKTKSRHIRKNNRTKKGKGLREQALAAAAAGFADYYLTGDVVRPFFTAAAAGAARRAYDNLPTVTFDERPHLRGLYAPVPGHEVPPPPPVPPRLAPTGEPLDVWRARMWRNLRSPPASPPGTNPYARPSPADAAAAAAVAAARTAAALQAADDQRGRIPDVTLEYHAPLPNFSDSDEEPETPRGPPPPELRGERGVHWFKAPTPDFSDSDEDDVPTSPPPPATPRTHMINQYRTQHNALPTIGQLQDLRDDNELVLPGGIERCNICTEWRPSNYMWQCQTVHGGVQCGGKMCLTCLNIHCNQPRDPIYGVRPPKCPICPAAIPPADCQTAADTPEPPPLLSTPELQTRLNAFGTI